MELQEVTQRVKEIASWFTNMPWEDMTDTTSVCGDMGFDEIDVAEFAMALEDEFDLTIHDNEVACDGGNGKTIGEIAAMIHERLKTRAAI